MKNALIFVLFLFAVDSICNSHNLRMRINYLEANAIQVNQQIGIKPILQEYQTLGDGTKIGRMGQFWFVLNEKDMPASLEGYDQIGLLSDGALLGKRDVAMYVLDEAGRHISYAFNEITPTDHGYTANASHMQFELSKSGAIIRNEDKYPGDRYSPATDPRFYYTW
ncbi:MAG: hypothetical protein U0522_02755 [Candidatus Paceibacterota bacterium]